MTSTYKVETDICEIYFETIEAAIDFVTKYEKQRGVVLEIEKSN